MAPASTVLFGPQGRIVMSLKAIGGTSCQGPVVVSLHFLSGRRLVVGVKFNNNKNGFILNTKNDLSNFEQLQTEQYLYIGY